MAQLVEHHLAKVGVAGSNPVVRSREVAGQTVRRSICRGAVDLPSRRDPTAAVMRTSIASAICLKTSRAKQLVGKTIRFTDRSGFDVGSGSASPLRQRDGVQDSEEQHPQRGERTDDIVGPGRDSQGDPDRDETNDRTASIAFTRRRRVTAMLPPSNGSGGRRLMIAHPKLTQATSATIARRVKESIASVRRRKSAGRPRTTICVIEPARLTTMSSTSVRYLPVR